MHSFQLKFLRSGLSHTTADHTEASSNLAKAREVVGRGLDDKW